MPVDSCSICTTWNQHSVFKILLHSKDFLEQNHNIDLEIVIYF